MSTDEEAAESTVEAAPETAAQVDATASAADPKPLAASTAESSPETAEAPGAPADRAGGAPDAPSAAAGDAPAGDAPAGDAPAGDAPAGDAQAGSASEATAADAPAGDASTGDAQAGTGDAQAGSVSEAAPADAPAAREGSAEASEASEGEASADGAPAPAKKKRRRRKKKKAEGAAEAAAPRPEPSRPAKKKAKLERPAFNVGDEVFGRVSQVTRFAIWLDVAGGKAQGLYDREELIQIPPRPGEQFIAKVKSFSTRGGMLMLGRELWDPMQARAEIRAALETQAPLDFFVTGVIKGGLEVDYKGVRAFAPASHVELRPGSDLSHLLGEKTSFVVTHYGKKGRDVVVSRKQMLESEHQEKRAAELAKLEPDMQVKAVVRNVLSWGAFVSLPEYGDLEGVIHMSEVSHDRSARLSEVLSSGAEIEVKVLKIDDKGKLWLSHKATQDDPWAEAEKKYAAGTIHTGKVVRLTEFGAFVQLEPGIDGLCHVADLSPFNPIDHPKEAVAEGADLEVVVAYLDPRQRKITLHPAPPAEERDKKRIGKLAPHQKVEAVVMQIRDAGLGVRIVGATGRHSRAFIPAGQTGTPRGTDLRKEFPLGKTVEAKVIEADRRGEARLSIRALKDDAEKQAYREYRKKVQREATFGTFGDLLKGKL